MAYFLIEFKSGERRVVNEKKTKRAINLAQQIQSKKGKDVLIEDYERIGQDSKKLKEVEADSVD